MSDSTSFNFSCKDEKYKGFDLQAGKTWIYPTNYPLRDYQYNIIQEALLKNTLVSLPTGLGKTFIAAVVMYNFYRWYPSGKIIFMAPTRPLVKQQIDACYNIMAIPKETTAELTGSNTQNARTDIWKDKRVFFVTAQVLSNDLDRIAELGPKIKCLVFDEAHRAKGNYAYCLVIRKLLPKTKNFRVLALSATPGNNISDVEEVVQNLLISHIELRTEESPDVVPYTFQKNLETIVVPIGKKLTEIRDRYIQILEKYTRVLLKHRVIQGNCSSLTKGKIFMTLKEFQERNRTTRCEAYAEITKNLNICVTLYHGFELLIRHGLRGFLSFFQEHAEKPLLRGNAELFDIMRDVNDYLGPTPDLSPLPDGTTPEIPENTRFGHPKFYKLCDILLAHFTEYKIQSSRVIVFCEYRESVMEVYALLLQQKPLIKPKVFIGQGAITQRQQLNVIQSFVQGECNTLISTCIGEEGLDVGEVDLIVCFDISNKSPVRMIQRIGRTGRKRDGRVVILVTEGKEEQTLKACLIQKDFMSRTILGSVELASKLYKENSRMIPDDIVPECMKISITVKKDVKIKNETIKGMFSRMENALTQGSSKKDITDLIPDAVSFWDKSNPLQLKNPNDNKINFSKNLERQRKLQTAEIFGHSKDSELLVSLLQFADSKRFNLPMTQEVLVSQFSQVPIKQKSRPQKSNGYKQADLRSMLFKAPATSEASNEEIVINQKIFDYLQSLKKNPNTCKICDNFFDCNQFKTKNLILKTNEWFIPDLKILDSISNENFEAFKKSLDPFSEDVPDFPEPIEDEFSKNNSIAFELPRNFDDVVKKCDSTFFENVDFMQLEKNANKQIVVEDPEEVLRFFKLNSLEDLFKPPQATDLLDDTIIYEPELDTIEEKLSPVLTKTQKESKDEEGSPILCSYERSKFLKDRVQKKLFTSEQDCLTQVNTKPRLSNLLQKRQSSFYAGKGANKTLSISPEEAERKVVLNNSLFEAFDETLCAEKVIGKMEDIDDIFDTSFLNQNNKSVISKEKGTKEKDEIFVLSENEKNIVATSESQNVRNVFEKGESTKIEDIDDIFDVTFLSQNNKKATQKEKSTKMKGGIFDTTVRGENQKKVLATSESQNICEKRESTRIEDIDDVFDTSFLSRKDVKSNSTSNSQRLNSLSQRESSSKIENNILKNSLLNKSEKKAANVKATKVDILSDLDDICDISVFATTSKKGTKTSSNAGDLLDIADICDISAFISDDKQKVEPKKQDIPKKKGNDLSNLLDLDDICDISVFQPKKFSLKTQSIEKNKQELTKATLETTKSESQVKSLKTALKTKKSDNVKPTIDSKSPLAKKQEKLSPVFVSSKIDDSSANKSSLKTHNKHSDSEKLNKTPESRKNKSQFPQESLSDFEDSFYFKSFKTPKKLRLSTASKTRNTDVILKKYLPDYNRISCGLSSPSTTKKPQDETSRTKNTNSFLSNKPNKSPSASAESQYTITQILNIINSDDKTTSKSATQKKEFDSEDEFETHTPSKNRLKSTPKTDKTIKTRLNFESDDEFEVPLSPKIKKNLEKFKNTKKKKREANPFIELEAEVSEEEGVTVSDDESVVDDDCLESSFVNDETQAFTNTQMHVHYLQSVKSPKASKGFKIPKLPKLNRSEVFSQPVVDVDNTYLNDTFCVESEGLSPEETEPSELEIAEMILREERKRKRQQKTEKPKKRRVFRISDDSD